MTPEQTIAEVMRRRGWTCEYHEPVSDLGECSQCDDSHIHTGAEIVKALTANGYVLRKRVGL